MRSLIVLGLFVLCGCSLPVKNYTWEIMEIACADHAGIQWVESQIGQIDARCQDGKYISYKEYEALKEKLKR